jgi:hypothetical protein
VFATTRASWPTAAIRSPRSATGMLLVIVGTALFAYGGG